MDEFTYGKAAELEVVISEEAVLSNENEGFSEVDDMNLNGVEPLSKFKVVGNDDIVVVDLCLVLFVVDQVS